MLTQKVIDEDCQFGLERLEFAFVSFTLAVYLSNFPQFCDIAKSVEDLYTLRRLNRDHCQQTILLIYLLAYLHLREIICTFDFLQIRSHKVTTYEYTRQTRIKGSAWLQQLPGSQPHFEGPAICRK